MRRSLRLRLLLVAVGVTLVRVDPVDADQRGLLWRVVQGCLLNASITGAPFPCLKVSTPDGRETGYAVLRAPFDRAHLIVTPTVRTIGIEATRLRGSDAPNYFQDAWASRAYVAGAEKGVPGRSDLALAVNSRPGRSQDQLHVHIACIRADIRDAVLAKGSEIHAHSWFRMKVLPWAPAYTAHFEPSADLGGVNVFDRVADGLQVKPKDMHDVTIVVLGAEPSAQAPAGFFILARRRLPHGFDTAHGEALLDPACTRFAKS